MSFGEIDGLEKPRWAATEDDSVDAWSATPRQGEGRQDSEDGADADAAFSSHDSSAATPPHPSLAFGLNDDAWGTAGDTEPFGKEEVFASNFASNSLRGRADSDDDTNPFNTTSAFGDSSDQMHKTFSEEPADFTNGFDAPTPLTHDDVTDTDFDSGFGQIKQDSNENEDDDDFGDFGDFDEAGADAFGDAPNDDGFDEQPVAEAPPPPAASIPAIDVSDTSVEALRNQIQPIFAALYPVNYFQLLDGDDDKRDSDDPFTRLPPEFLAYTQQMLAPLDLKPINWKRSLTRRHYLTALGMPVNLDELIESQGILKVPTRTTLGSMQDSEGVTRPISPGPTSAPLLRVSSSQTSHGTRRLASPAPTPAIDRSRALALLSLTDADFRDMSAEDLLKIRTELENMVSLASDVLTHTLERREKLQTDGETYDRMIQDLVSTAQKMKGGVANSSLRRSGSLPKSSSRAMFAKRDSSPAQSTAASASGIKRPASRAGSLAV